MGARTRSIAEFVGHRSKGFERKGGCEYGSGLFPLYLYRVDGTAR